MNTIRIFISSVQREFTQERKALRDFLQNDPFMRACLYLNRYIEKMGTRTVDMIRRCRDAGLPEPEFNDSGGFKITIWRATFTGQPESLPEALPEALQSRVIVLLANGPMQKSELSKSLGQKAISAQLNVVVRKLVVDQLIEYTIPDKPNSRLQKYRLTDKGKTELSKLKSGNAV